MKGFNIRLNNLRCENNLSTKDFANKLNISYKTALSYLKGKTEPRGNNLVKMAKLFNVSTDFLIGLTENRQNKKHD